MVVIGSEQHYTIAFFSGQFFRNLSMLLTQLEIGSSLFSNVSKFCFHSFSTVAMHPDWGNIFYSLVNKGIIPLYLARFIYQKVCSQEG